MLYSYSMNLQSNTCISSNFICATIFTMLKGLKKTRRNQIKMLKSSWAVYGLWDYEYFQFLASLHFSERSKISTKCMLF